MEIPIYVLSLRRMKERRHTVQEEMARHGLRFRIVDAVDGTVLSAAELDDAYDADANMRAFKRPLSVGEIACALTHRAIWNKIASDRDRVAMVCEDDMHFLAAPRSLLECAALASDYLKGMIVKLDGARAQGKRIGRLGDRDLISSRRLPPRTTGYLIGRDAARQLLDHSGRIYRPVDTDLKRYWDHRIPVLVAQPQLIEERPGTVSSLTPSRTECKAGSGLDRMRRNLLYQSDVLLHRALSSPSSLHVDALSAHLHLQEDKP